MKIVTEVKTKQEFDEIKTIMEIFVVTNRIKQIAEST